MREWKLRGYLTPEDFTGTDGEKLQLALNKAAELDIRKVIVTGIYHAEMPLIMPKAYVNEWIRPDADPEELVHAAMTEMVCEKVETPSGLK